ncbi:DUF1800 domain-containing protein [Williamsia sterculiae]|uniref:Uncharacterized conserved protein, DUF1800 family n=1 Tax=Williamsia sterculiae TaxID=1344003 RepID=A0A1N7F281_9NOCA|nr:DUF1800 domain-containing protein [Williamsia sterculiae]SIR94419.1 Uncharacterized conserved protein, DUF1800 family [Williamsia sterculiae]
MSQSAEWMTTARVVRRLGFGATGVDVDAAVGRGVAAYVAEALAPTRDDQGVAATPAPSLPHLTPAGKQASADERKKARAQIAEQQKVVTTWWIHRMVAAQHPTTEKLTFLWHNHFATSLGKVRSAQAMLAQNEKLRSMGLGEFRPLAYAMLTDAAMLQWLDGSKNVKDSPNENLAREFMELFALGHGNGYTENDVREGARALTGWRTDADGSTTLVDRKHDSGSKTVLGVTGNLDAGGFCDAVLDHPASEGYVATRWWQQLASTSAPSNAALQRLTTAYGPRRDLRALITGIVTDPEFATPNSSIVMSPVDWVVGATRALSPHVDTRDLTSMTGTLRKLGQLPFRPPSVGGWPGGQAWLSTAGAETRWATATKLTKRPQVTTVVDAAPGDRIDAAAHLLGVGAFSDRTVSVLKPHVGDPPTLTAIALNSPEYLTA